MPDSSTILLVDDEDSVQKLLAYPLEREGFRVLQARDGEEALARFAEEHVDLVVLDLMLPKLDGLEVCKRLRAESEVPIIMLTARDDELDKVLGLELGADDYITKPFSIREFRSRVRALLRRAAATRPSGGGELIVADGLKIDVGRGDRIRISLDVQARRRPSEDAEVDDARVGALFSCLDRVVEREARAVQELGADRRRGLTQALELRVDQVLLERRHDDQVDEDERPSNHQGECEPESPADAA